MTENTISYTRTISHIILVTLSMMLSINLFVQFSDVVFIQVLFGSMAAALEMLKLYLLIIAKDRFTIGGWKNDLVATVQFMVYVGLAFISIVASLGFTLVSIEEQSLSFRVEQSQSNFRIEQLLNELESNNRQIEIIQENASGLEFSAVERNAEANSQVVEIQQRNEEIINRIEGLREENLGSEREAAQLTSSDMFILLGESVGLSGRDAMFYMMLVLVILLEVSIAITSASIDDHKKVFTKFEKIGIVDYIDALFSEDGKRLVPDKRIAKKANLSIEDCHLYREALKNITYKGTPMISSKQGATTANFSKDNMKKIVQFHEKNRGVL